MRNIPHQADSTRRVDGLAGVLLQAAVEKGISTRLEVAGRSMLPLVRAGDIVQIGPVTEAGLELGDVVAVRSRPSGMMLVHRVVARSGDALVVQGDSAARADGSYLPEDIVGVVERVERRGRRVWFGAGCAGSLTAWAVRCGIVRRFALGVLSVRKSWERLRTRPHRGSWVVSGVSRAFQIARFGLIARLKSLSRTVLAR